ncbi:DUF2267 domain-containing protein [Thioclava atlantica]|uniref:DUF2267 domain-containing protein n=1 Tax=Thioclava atlantica TaxID=1317124 RepID=A0A085TT40_9RHOB|nr:DUF2267 domain-containing protein [Thioclava atlantica]KFE33887.1 hypothetical protein DW2_15515 [Thioclava atlantica]
MKTTGISSLDHAPQVVAEWLNDLEGRLGEENRSRTYMLLRATLHAVRDFLSTDESADLAAQLPVMLRGIYFEGFVPSRQPAHPRGKQAFLDRVNSVFHDDPLDDPEAAVSAVFDLLHDKISAGEYEQVAKAMRGSLRALLV